MARGPRRKNHHIYYGEKATITQQTVVAFMGRSMGAKIIIFVDVARILSEKKKRHVRANKVS